LGPRSTVVFVYTFMAYDRARGSRCSRAREQIPGLRAVVATSSQRTEPTINGDGKIITRSLFALCAFIAALAPAPLLAQETQPAEACPRGAVGDIPESLRAVKDEAGATFYRHQSSPLGPGEQAFFLYIGKKACEVWLRIRIQFPGDKPSGNTRIRIQADDKSYEFAARRLTQSEDANSRGYWYDELVEPDHLLMLFKVAASAHATVRLESGNGADEHVVSDREKQALTVVLGAYNSLGGKLSHSPLCPSCPVHALANACDSAAPQARPACAAALLGRGLDPLRRGQRKAL